MIYEYFTEAVGKPYYPELMKLMKNLPIDNRIFKVIDMLNELWEYCIEQKYNIKYSVDFVAYELMGELERIYGMKEIKELLNNHFNIDFNNL